MDGNNAVLTDEQRSRLEGLLRGWAGRGEMVVAIKDVPVGEEARVAFEEGGVVRVSPLRVTAVALCEVLARHVSDDEDVALCPDCPCLVQM